ncbi:MAG: stage V sporulation protein D [Clostridia bacterium]|nr:stage V sporulation protein D [Clostridia bacterium]
MVIEIEYSITKLRKRLFAVFLLIAFIFCIISARFFYVQLVWGKELQSKALDQWTRELPVTAERGAIMDRNGVALVENRTAYSVYIRPRSVKDADRTADVLSSVLGLDRSETYRKATTKTTSEYAVARKISAEKVNELSVYELPGVYFSKDNERYYPYGDFLSQVLGYVSSDNVGQTGLEKYYDKYLRGRNGEIVYETDLLGIQLDGSGVSYLPAVKGLDLVLTIDYAVQLIAEQVMETAYAVHSPKRAECIVLDPSNGEILAMASRPSFDMNYVPRNEPEKLNFLGRNGLVSDSYEPGSTFKILTASANIEEYFSGNKAAFSLDHVFNPAGTRTVLGRKIKCWTSHANGKHSHETIKEALNNSCNPCFVDMALALGKETVYKYIEAFNYGSLTGIDFVGEAQGMVLPVSAVTDGDLARIGFGQTIAVTPVQLAAATASAVNGGNYFVPHFLKAVYDGERLVEKVIPVAKNRTVSEKTSAVMAEYLEGVVKDGSGKQAYIEGYRVGGKTGTAQKYENGVIAQGKYVASFVGFFPADKPEYLALVIVDEPVGQHYGSTVAAPYAKMIFEGIINEKEIRSRV